VVVPQKDLTADEAQSRIDAHMHEVSGNFLSTSGSRFEIRERSSPHRDPQGEAAELVPGFRRKDSSTRRSAPATDTDKSGSSSSWPRRGKPRSAVSLDVSLDELGFDSLMYHSSRARSDPRPEEPLGRCPHVHDRIRGSPTTKRRPHRGYKREGARQKTRGGEGELPDVVRTRVELSPRSRSGSITTAAGSKAGQHPSHVHFLVVANHASHLDMGLVKMALGESGRTWWRSPPPTISSTTGQAHLLRELHEPRAHGTEGLAPEIARVGVPPSGAGLQRAHLPRGHALPAGDATALPEGARTSRAPGAGGCPPLYLYP
jgi:hypothetical protein